MDRFHLQRFVVNAIEWGLLELLKSHSMKKLVKTRIRTLPQISGFIGSDILSAELATNLEEQPDGTLLIDLGTNGELLFKAKDRRFATSCATGPAFEGASLSCGMQAIPGAISKVVIEDIYIFPTAP